MKSRFSQPNDGIAKIELTELKGGLESVSRATGIRLKRGKDHNYLNSQAGRWDSQVSVINIVPKVAGNAAVIDLPSGIVNLLDQDAYQLDLVGDSGDLDMTRFSLKSVRYSRGKGASVEKKPESAPTPTPVSAPAPKPETQAPKAVPVSETPKKSNLPLILGCCAAAVVATAILAYWLLNKDRAVEAPKQETAAVEVVPQKSYREQVREFFANKDRTAENALKLAEGFKPQSAEDEDTLFRLYYFAASKDDKAAFVPYAKFFDPTQPQMGSIKKDPYMAWDYYTKGGDTSAAQALKAWLEKEAASGNESAKAILEKIRK